MSEPIGTRTQYKLWDATTNTWVTYWLTTSADAVFETENRCFVTPAQQELLNEGTNVKNGLLQLNSSGKVNASLLPSLSGTYALFDHNHDSVYSKLAHNHNDIYEPLIGDKKTAFNKNFAGTGTASTVSKSDHNHDETYAPFVHNHATLYEPVFTKNNAFNKSFTASGGTNGTEETVSRGDHNHSGVYEPVINRNSAFNLNKATKVQAQAGAVDTVLMTPLRTKEAIEELSPPPQDASVNTPGIVKLSSTYNPATAYADTAINQVGTKEMYSALKAYADTVAGMGFRPQVPCQFAIVGDDANGYPLNGTLSGLVQIGDRVLISDRTNKAENGIYTVNSGAWTKDPESVKSGATTFILKELSSGTNDTIWWYNAEQEKYVLFSRIDVAQESTTIVPTFTENNYKLNIKGDAITTYHIADEQVTTGKIKDGNVTENKLADNAVTTGKIKDANVTAEKLDDDAVTTDKIKNSNVTEAKLATNAVITAKIKDGAVTEDKLGSGAVTQYKLGNGAVTEAKLGSGAVTVDKLGSSAVTDVKLATDAVITDKIKNYAVTQDKVASNAVITAKIKDGAVTTDKILDANVTTEKLYDKAVTMGKLNDKAVTEVKLADGAVTGVKLANEAVGLNNLDGDVKEIIKKVTVSLTAPTNPNTGDIWLDLNIPEEDS